MKDPKEVMRAYSKEEFPELTKALNSMPTAKDTMVEINGNCYFEHGSVRSEEGELKLEFVDFPSVEVLQSFYESCIKGGRSGKSLFYEISILIAISEKLKETRPVRIVYYGGDVPGFLQKLSEAKYIEIVEPKEEKGVSSEPLFVIDDFDTVTRQTTKGFARMLRVPQHPHTKKSQSNDPSDRWIKPKKLRRAKGGRK